MELARALSYSLSIFIHTCTLSFLSLASHPNLLAHTLEHGVQHLQQRAVRCALHVLQQRAERAQRARRQMSASAAAAAAVGALSCPAGRQTLRCSPCPGQPCPALPCRHAPALRQVPITRPARHPSASTPGLGPWEALEREKIKGKK